MSKRNEQTNHATQNSIPMPAIDRTGATYTKPSKWRERLFFFVVLLLIVLGVALYVMGFFFLGIALITACLAGVAILAIVARTSINRFFGHQEQRYSANALGRYLAADIETIKADAPTLTDEEAEAINLHRGTEAVLVNEWVVNARTPRKIQVRSDDGTMLVGRMIPGTKRSRPWVLMLHGYAGTWRDSLAFSRIYAAHDCNIMLVDMRAHGESEGTWTGSGWLERRDVVAWCSWIVARTGEDAQIIVHGQGMGATAALFAAAEADLPAQVRAIISDSAYTDAWNETSLRLGTGFAKPQPTLNLYRYAMEKAKDGYDIAVPDVLQVVPSITTPLFILQGEEDNATPPYMGMYIAMAAGCDISSIVDAVAAKEVMAYLANIKEEALLEAEKAAQAAAEAEAKKAAKAAAAKQDEENFAGDEAETEETKSEPAEELAAEQADADDSDSANTAADAQDDESEPAAETPEAQETRPLSALEVAKELAIGDAAPEHTEEETDIDVADAEEHDEADNAAEPESNDGEEHNDDAADANADETDAEGEEEAPANDPFADYPEDDLSDLFADQPAVEEGAEIQEPSPHMAFGATGNVFFYAPAAGHCQSTFACPTAYENAINAFLTRCIG